MKSRFPTTSDVAARALRRAFPSVALLAGSLVLAGSVPVASAAAESGTRPQTWQVAPAGPCARVDTSHPCSGGQCAGGETSARSRFDATDVASGVLDGGGVFAPPEPLAFRGPGPCADPSTPCGDAQSFRSPSSATPGGPGVIEQPVTPGTLPGTLPGLP